MIWGSLEAGGLEVESSSKDECELSSSRRRKSSHAATRHRRPRPQEIHIEIEEIPGAESGEYRRSSNDIELPAMRGARVAARSAALSARAGSGDRSTGAETAAVRSVAF